MRASVKKSSKTTILKEGRFFRFIKKDGWEYFERSNCTDIVIILAVTKNKKVIFIEQYRPPVGKNVIEFPAGLVNDAKDCKHESVAAGAKRELFEETGYKARKIIPILKGPSSSGSSADLVTMVRAVDIEKVGEGTGDGTESIKVHEVPLAKVDQWLKSMEKKGCLIEPKVYAGLYFLNKKKS